MLEREALDGGWKRQMEAEKKTHLNFTVRRKSPFRNRSNENPRRKCCECYDDEMSAGEWGNEKICITELCHAALDQYFAINNVSVLLHRYRHVENRKSSIGLTLLEMI